MDEKRTIQVKTSVTLVQKATWPDDYEGMTLDEAVQYERTRDEADVLTSLVEALDYSLDPEVDYQVEVVEDQSA